MLRSGPAIKAHFAHRPRQSCRRRPSERVAVRPLNLEQLTLFELEPQPIPTFHWEPPAVEFQGSAPRRRRRKAWLPRLVRWVKARTARVYS